MNEFFANPVSRQRSAFLSTAMTARTADSFQENLTRALIIPHIEGIAADLESLREAVDREVERYRTGLSGDSPDLSGSDRNGFAEAFASPILAAEVCEGLKDLSRQQVEAYPIGACMPITRIVFNVLKHDALVNRAAGLSKLGDFIRRGGLFQMIWGGIRGEYFQTAFQAGSYYIDVANNTVVPSAPQIAHAFLSESGFKNILSYDAYIPIRKNYHQVSLHLNTGFPELFPFFPLLAVSEKDGRVSLDTSFFMAERNIETRFQTVLDALATGQTAPDLDKTVLDRLAGALKHMTGGGDKPSWMAYGLINRNDMIRILERQVSDFDRYEQHRRLSTAVKIAHAMNVIWDLNRITRT